MFELSFFGFWFGAREEVFEEVFDAEVGVSTVSKETVAALAGLAIDVARDGEDVFALGESMGGGVERARAFTGLYDYDDVGKAGDDAVALEEGSLGVDLVAKVVFAGDYAAFCDDFFGELGVFGGVNAFDFGAEDGDGGAATGKGAAGGDGVNAVGEAGDDDNSLFRQGFGEVVGDFFPVFAVFAGADDGDGFDAFFWPFSIVIQ